ncbi:hypothetical protein [Aquimarina aquimarini]|uniref:hypothetical protein n=1 Tax=Aquimarina aquimarini TaxID=1191734 RepID=UPI000D56285C|nr:hypothetical protein [Aquimarina aquimarini]
MNPKIRLQQPEQLDNLSLSGSSLQNTLSSLKFINTFFGNHRQLSNSIVSYCKSKPALKTFNIVDIGCGGGDCIAYISKELKTIIQNNGIRKYKVFKKPFFRMIAQITFTQ